MQYVHILTIKLCLPGNFGITKHRIGGKSDSPSPAIEHTIPWILSDPLVRSLTTSLLVKNAVEPTCFDRIVLFTFLYVIVCMLPYFFNCSLFFPTGKEREFLQTNKSLSDVSFQRRTPQVG